MRPEAEILELRNRIVILRMVMREASSKLPAGEIRELLRDAVNRDAELEDRDRALEEMLKR